MQLSGEVGRLVDTGCSAERFSGAVLVASGDTVLIQKACGEASRRYHVPNTPGTLFNIGSMDKMFTAVAAMQLVEAGKVSLDATLDCYLDASWLDPAVAQKVTVWQLMTHTSGLSPDVAGQLEDLPRDRYRELNDYKPLMRSAHLAFAPGSRFAYSNTGMLFLGAVVAQASGEDYFEYVRQHVFRPAGMTSTGSFAADDPVEHLAVGYSPVPGTAYGWRENSVRNFLRGMPAGGSYSTVGDLHRFARALQSGKLLSQASVRRLWADPGRNNYGAGFETGDGAVGHVVGHSGLFYGVSTRMRLYLESGYVVVVLANVDRAAPPLLDAIEGQILLATPPN
jgi:CubicO group peptidase (beta-lactamase class C family)